MQERFSLGVLPFNKGYNNHRQFSEFCDKGVHFVTRLKDNADYKVVRRLRTHCEKITSDWIISFTGNVAGRKCPHELRRIRSVDPKTGKAIVLLTNMRGVSASENAVKTQIWIAMIVYLLYMMARRLVTV